MAQHLVTKSEYARLRGRTPAAVTHWINDGKLVPPAIVPDPTGNAWIDVEAADAMLAVTLDPSQQQAQAQPLGVAPTAALPPAGDDEAADAAVAAEPADDDNRRFIRARADRMEREAEQLRRRQLAESGAWVEADRVKQSLGREAAKAIAEFDAWLDADLAEKLAAELGLDERTIATIIAKHWRAFRERQAQSRRPAQPAAPRLDQAAE